MFLASGHDVRDLIRIKAQYIKRSSVSTAIRPDPNYHYLSEKRGYDGMDYYFIAVDPANARYYVDSPTYRYTRIVYPLLARFVARGRTSAIPYAMVFINIAAMTLSTLLLAVSLRRRSLSPWMALIFGLYAGLFFATTWDLTEPLAFAFVLLGIVLMESRARWTFMPAAAAFGLAALTRESIAVFPLVYACIWPPAREASDKQRGQVVTRFVAFVGVSVGPLLAYKAFLVTWLGGRDRSVALLPDPLPFHGLAVYFPWDASRVVEFVCVVVPALVCGAMALRAVKVNWRRPEVWALLANICLFVVFLNASSYWNYTASGRIAAGVVLCALLSIPAFDEMNGGKRGWLWLCVPLWVVLTPVLYVLPFTTNALY